MGRPIALNLMLAFSLAAGLALPLAGCAGADDATADGNQSERSASASTEASAAEASPASDAAPTPSTAGKLHVEGSQLVGEDGQPVQLRGVSTHGLAWFPQYVNGPFFRELRQDWGANVVRLALYTAESGGYCEGGDQAKLEQLVEDGVAYAAEADLYAVVDWHILSDANPLAHLDEAKAFFAKMSERLAGRDNVIYEICNEPNGATTWADVKAYANEVIPVIRQNAPDAVVVVGTPTWSQRVDEAAADPLGIENVMYALHFYAATHQQDLRDRMRAAVGAGLPVFVSEFGICDASGNGRVDYASADAWVSLMDELDVSYICWNLSNKDEASALFKPGCQKASGFSEADLSAEGLWLQKVLRGELPEDGASSAGANVAGAGGSGDAGATGSAGDAITGSAGSLSFTAQVVNSWEAGGRTHVQYAVAMTNDGDAMTGWEVTVPIGRPFALVDSWNGRFDACGTDLHIANADYNGAIPAGGSVADVGFIVGVTGV